MATFDIRQDAPGLLRNESLNITIKFDRTSPTTGRISWNIPTPAAGCLSTDQAYCGIIITLDTTPISNLKHPVDSTVYSSDPTANQNLFAGDKLGTAFIVGAFYNDRTTTYLDISGLSSNTPYYVSGFPTDCQYRYYKEGVHAYSLDHTNRGLDGTSGSQRVMLNTTGIQPTDFTGLMTGITYDFKIQLGVIPQPRTPLDPNDCNPAPLTYTIHVDGTKSATYTDLVNELNKQLSLIGNNSQGPIPPNTGGYYWNGSQLLIWSGLSYNSVPAIIQNADPTTIQTGEYWYNPTSDVLQIKTDVDWLNVSIISSIINPLNPQADTSYWFDGTIAHKWNGTSWCSSNTIIAEEDPTTYIPPLLGSFWYDNQLDVFYKWDSSTQIWVYVDVTKYSYDPYQLIPETLWFNTTNNTLNQLDVPNVGWNIIPNVAIAEREPSTPAPGKYWFNPITKELKQWSALLFEWQLIQIIVSETDPTIVSSCDLWWNTTEHTLYVWNELDASWVAATIVYEQSNDPSEPVIINDGTFWFKPSTRQLFEKTNNCFVSVNYIDYPVNPIDQIIPGTAWHKIDTDQWYIMSLNRTWILITPIISVFSPSELPAQSFWFNTSNNSLQMWNGIGWVSITYSTISLEPIIGQMWFDTSTNILKQWNGTNWELATPKATAELDCHGNLVFTDTTISSLSFVQLTDSTLFKSLTVPYSFNDPKPGTDSNSNVPTYNEYGIGTDGSNDERLLLMNEIRMELGYPVVDVELTNEQLDYAITKTLNEVRTKSGIGYRRGFFFMRVNPETQRYYLTNKTGEFNKIVDILSIQRLTSAFLSSAHGAGVYGQIVLQHLYNMGTFDLLSYHIITEYVKTMEILFAARLTFNWNEQTRELWIHHRFPFTEPYVLIEATVERTEQDIMVDRYCKPWVRRYAVAQARLMLAEIRGKYSTLPGAGGGVTLNANDLRMAAKEEIETCLNEIESFIMERPEEYGMASTFIFG